jgi:hypothetical protein
MFSSLGHGAALGAELPVGLNIVPQAAHLEVVGVASSESAVQEVPGALVGILVSAGIIPGIQLRVTGSLFELMGNDANSCIYTGIAVGGNSLRNATAAVGHSNPCILDGHIAEIEVAVPATVNCAKSALGDITANRSKLYI